MCTLLADSIELGYFYLGSVQTILQALSLAGFVLEGPLVNQAQHLTSRSLVSQGGRHRSKPHCAARTILFMSRKMCVTLPVL